MHNLLFKPHTILLLFTVFSFVLAEAQNVNFHRKNFPDDRKGFREAVSHIRKGDRYYEMGLDGYSKAIKYYSKAHAFNPHNALLNYKLGKCFHYSQMRISAIQHLEKALYLDPNIAFDASFLLARSYQLTENFEQALKIYTNFRNSFSPEQMNTYGSAIDRRIRQCKTGIELIANPVNVTINKLDTVINSEYANYGPAVSADDSLMFFTSRREGGLSRRKSSDDGLFHEDIYISRKEANGWSAPENAGRPVNKRNHDAVAGISADGTKIFIRRGKKNSNIYVSELDGDNWTRPRRLPKPIKSNYNETSVALSPDGRTLFFVSDRPDGYGGKDIYKTTKDERGRWGPAHNLGAIINTPYDEESIFLHANGKTLYFSSKGHNSMGGYDIFKTEFENGSWSAPKNLGYPVNTPDNNMFFTMSACGLIAYMSSDRDTSKNHEDIYMLKFHSKPGIHLQARKQIVKNDQDEIPFKNVTLFKGFVKDSQTEKPLSATIKIFNLSSGEAWEHYTSNSTTGWFLVPLPDDKEYAIFVTAGSHLFTNLNMLADDFEHYEEKQKIIKLPNLEAGSLTKLNTLFFDSEKTDSLHHKSMPTLKWLSTYLRSNRRLHFEIKAYSNSSTIPDENVELAIKRAQNIANYLIDKGVNPNRLVCKGFHDENSTEQAVKEGKNYVRKTIKLKIIDP